MCDNRDARVDAIRATFQPLLDIIDKIEQNTITVVESGTSSSGTEQIRYLSSTDEPTENVDVVVDTNLDNYNPMDIFKSSWFQVIAGSLAFFILLMI